MRYLRSLPLLLQRKHPKHHQQQKQQQQQQQKWQLQQSLLVSTTSGVLVLHLVIVLLVIVVPTLTHHVRSYQNLISTRESLIAVVVNHNIGTSSLFPSFSCDAFTTTTTTTIPTTNRFNDYPTTLAVQHHQNPIRRNTMIMRRRRRIVVTKMKAQNKNYLSNNSNHNKRHHRTQQPTTTSQLVTRLRQSSVVTTTITPDQFGPATKFAAIVPLIRIEYCIGCKWNLRAHWMAQELLYHYLFPVSPQRHGRTLQSLPHNTTTTTNHVTTIGGVTLEPSLVAGTFRITIGYYNENPSSSTAVLKQLEEEQHVIWDRTIDTGFPEIYELQSRIDEYMCYDIVPTTTTTVKTAIPQQKPTISIRYDSGKSSNSGSPTDTLSNNFMFRASYVAQEIVSTFQNDIYAVSLIPNKYCINDMEPTTTTVHPFAVLLNDTQLIWGYNGNNDDDDNNDADQSILSRSRHRFIAMKELKQLIRDCIDPTKYLGHSDTVVAIQNQQQQSTNNVEDPAGTTTTTTTFTTTDDDDDSNDDEEEEDDNNAMRARNYYGVS